MEITSAYMKKRKEFGRQPIFCESPVQLIDSINPDPVEQKRYGLRNPVHEAIQYTKPTSETYMNTTRVEMKESGANHREGGWPRDVNINDEEAVLRFRRRVERDDDYVHAVLSTYPKLVHNIDQNNAIEMYQQYFSGMPETEPIEKPSLTVKNTYRLPSARPVSSISWTYEEDAKLVIAYTDTRYPTVGPLNEDKSCFIWNIELPNAPQSAVNPPSACWRLACSPFDPNVIVGGLADGRVCIFDIRTQEAGGVVALSPHHEAHRDPVNALLYLHSRMGTEFFSGSTDGDVKWWDTRDLSSPTSTLPMSVTIPPGEQANLGNAEPVSCLQFERSFPTRFLCGTDTGLVINVNRKGKSQSEIMSNVFHAHAGPVRAVHRSPLTAKMFITCGDWTVHVWSDDLPCAPIITGTADRYPVSDIVFLPHRFSSYMTVSVDGKLRYWDLLRKYDKPVVSLYVSKMPLLKITANEEGRLFAAGTKSGSVYLITLSENIIYSGEKDKALMLQSYERECRRERILEARVKEIKLKLREAEENPVVTEEVIDEDQLDRNAEEQYRKMVSDEIRALGITADSSGPMRKR